jgi:glutathione S-transferase
MYDFTLAPSPRRVRIFLAEKGIVVELVQVDIMRNANRTPEFYQRNPLGSLPILELEDGSCLSESVAICRYFEEIQPEPPLFGVDARAKAIVEMWNRRIELEIFAQVGHAWSHLSKVSEGRGRRLPEFGEIQKRAAIDRIAWLDAELKNREFIAGDKYSIADITTLCMIDFARAVDIRIQPGQTNLARWHSQVSSRPSANA